MFVISRVRLSNTTESPLAPKVPDDGLAKPKDNSMISRSKRRVPPPELWARVTKREFPGSSKQEAYTSQSLANKIQGSLEARGVYLRRIMGSRSQNIIQGFLEASDAYLPESGTLEASGVVLAESGNLEARGVVLAEPPYDR